MAADLRTQADAEACPARRARPLVDDGVVPAPHADARWFRRMPAVTGARIDLVAELAPGDDERRRPT